MKSSHFLPQPIAERSYGPAKNLITGQMQIWNSKKEYDQHKREADSKRVRADQDNQEQPPGITKATSPERSEISKPSRTKSAASSIAHDYINYIKNIGQTKTDEYDDEEEQDQDDDEERKGGGSVVGKKALQVQQGQYKENTVLMNSQGETIIVQGFYSFPMIADNAHQIDNSTSGVDLGAQFLSTFPTAKASAIVKQINTKVSGVGPNKAQPLNAFGSDQSVKGWVAGSKGKYKIAYVDNGTLMQQIAIASAAIVQAIPKDLLRLSGGKYPIFWVNPDAMSTATSFALSHWVLAPDAKYYKLSPEEKENYTGQLEHYVFGYFESDSIGILVNPEDPAKLFANFKVGLIEKLVDFWGFGARGLKRLSALRPSKVLDIKNTDQDTFNVLDRQLSAVVMTDPWSQLPQKIRSSYSKNQAKVDKLLEVTDQIIGSSPDSATSYPVQIDGMSVTEVGFSPNALGVDFMEVLHPLVLMKPDGAINNGLYNAAYAYLGSSDLSDCVVAYPSAENAALFDSMLMSADRSRHLLISSKAGAGAKPSASILGDVYDNLLNSLDKENMPDFIRDDFNRLQRSYPGYGELVRFLGKMRRGVGESELRSSIPSNAITGKIARKLINLKTLDAESRQRQGEKLAAELNTMNNGRFLRYCEFLISHTNLVQVNTQIDYGADKTSATVNGFLATWPNKIFDRIEFGFLAGSLKFGVDIGGGAGYTSSSREQAPRFDRWMGRDRDGKKRHMQRYVDPGKLGKTGVVSSGGKKWLNIMRDMNNELRNTKIAAEKKNKSLRSSALDNPNLIKLYNQAIEMQKTYGADPSITGGTKNNEITMTNRDLVKTVGKLLR